MNYRLLLTVLVSSIVLVSCYRAPNDEIFADDLDMIITNYQAELDYPNEYQTYIIADSFGLASNVDDIDKDLVNDPAFRGVIKNAIARNMDAYGYVMVDTITDTPDVYIPINIVYYNTQGVSWNPIWMPGWGYGWGYPGYGWGGGGYVGWIPTSYSYEQGNIIIDWLDVKNRKDPLPPDTNYRFDIVWDMNIAGLIQGLSDRERNEKLDKAIDKGFEQSPYLDKNN